MASLEHNKLSTTSTGDELGIYWRIVGGFFLKVTSNGEIPVLVLREVLYDPSTQGRNLPHVAGRL